MDGTDCIIVDGNVVTVATGDCTIFYIYDDGNFAIRKLQPPDEDDGLKLDGNIAGRCLTSYMQKCIFASKKQVAVNAFYFLM